MKAGALAAALSKFSLTLRESGAGASVVSVQELADVLARHSGMSVAQFAKSVARRRDDVSNGSGSTARELVEVIASLRVFLGPLVSKGVAADFDELVRMLQRLGDTPLATLTIEPVASASRRRTPRGAAPVNYVLVDSYLRRLQVALGDDDSFMDLYKELHDDERVTREDAVCIADRFIGPVPPSTSRPKALQRILSRHRKLMGFEAGSASIGGRATQSS